MSLLADIIELSPQGIIVVDSSTHIVILENDCSRPILQFWQAKKGIKLSDSVFTELVSLCGKALHGHIQTRAQKFRIKVIRKDDCLIVYTQDISLEAALRAKQQTLAKRSNLITQYATDIIVRLDTSGNFLYLSPSSLQLTGYEPAELLGKSIFALAVHEDHPKMMEGLNEISLSDNASTIQFQIDCKLTKPIWIEAVFKRVPSTEAGFQEIHGICREISARKVVETSLQKSEALHKAIVNNITEGLIVLDTNGKVTFLNSSLCTMMGISDDSLLGKHISLFNTNLKPGFVQSKLTERLEGITETYTIEVALYSGKKRWLEITGTPYKNSDGQIDGSMSVIHDITEKFLQQAELDKLSLVASKTDNGVIITNASGKIEWINESFTRISGYTLDDIEGKTPGSFLQGQQTDPEAIDFIRKSLEKNKSFSSILLNYNKNKKPYWAHIEITPILDQQGNLTSFFSLHRDTTERIQTLELLKEREERYKNLLGASFEGIVVHNNHLVLDCNTRFVSLLGYNYQEVINTPIGKYIPARYENRAAPTTLHNSEPCEYAVIRKDNKVVPVEMISRKHQYKNSTVKVTLIKDISDHLRTLKQLKESESKYRDLVEASTDFIYTADHLGNFLYINNVGLRKMGYTQEEFMQLNFIDLIPPDWKQRVADFYQQQFKRKERESYFELPVNNKHGQIIWIGQNVQMQDDNGWITGFQAYARDISERKNIEAELDKQKHLLNFILDALPISIFLQTSENKILFINEEAKNLHSENPPQVSALFSAAVDPSSSQIIEGKITQESTMRHFLSGSKLIKTDFFEESLLLGYALDITDRKLAEQALFTAKQKAEESMQAKERFISIMSHEIRTPMNAVVGITNLLVQQSHSVEQKEYLHALKTSSDNLLKILNNVLDLSKLESGKISFESIDFDIREILSDVLETFKFKAAEKNIDLSSIISPLVPDYMKGDPVRLHQILGNLVSNALKFTIEGQVIIEIYLNQNQENGLNISFSVSDTGIGIPKNKQSDIFESFTQVSSETFRKFGGTGLGLTITKRLIELQGGSIRVDSELDKGSTFTFDLNFKPGERIDEFLDNQPPYHLEGIKLLLVEDNEMSQMVATRFLEKLNIEVSVADNGQEAIKMLDYKTYDIVLMDLQMPVMDGYEATKLIRSKKNNNMNIPIIALTASSLGDIESKIRLCGMNGFLTKPFQPSHLYATLAKHLRKEVSKPVDPLTNMKRDHSPYHIINLDYLKDASNGNVLFIKNMIEIFLKQTPGYLKEIHLAYDKQDWEKLRKTIHKMKPTIPMMGIQMQKEVAEIEDYSKNLVNLEDIPPLLQKLEAACEAAYDELNTELEIMK